MPLKIVASIVAVALLFAYLGPIVIRLRETALTVVVLVGVAMMLIDLWESLQSKDD